MIDIRDKIPDTLIEFLKVEVFALFNHYFVFSIHTRHGYIITDKAGMSKKCVHPQKRFQSSDLIPPSRQFDKKRRSHIIFPACRQAGEIGRAHVRTAVTVKTRYPASSFTN